MMDPEVSQHILSSETNVCQLDCMEAFGKLTKREKKYAHYLSRAAFHGGLICLFQTSPESPGIFLLLHRLFCAQTPADLKVLAQTVGFSAEEVKALMIYAAGVYCNMGNYKAYGDIKFIPNLPKEKFHNLVMRSAARAADPDGMESLLSAVLERIYSLEDHERELEFPPKGITTYFSANCTMKDAEIALEFLLEKNISPYNTRLFKTTKPGSTSPVYELWLASAETEDGKVPGFDHLLGTYQFQSKDGSKPVTFKVTRGDYSKLLALVCDNLKQAKKFAANEVEVTVLDKFITSFTTGSIPAHMDASRSWIQNKTPTVETYMAFLEPYRDPCGIRGEFEAFVGIVNKEVSSKFEQLVKIGEELIALLPWPAEFERQRFLAPDFTALDVLTYAGSGVYNGINIPNYDEIRQNEGFKNLCFENVFTSKEIDYVFLSPEDNELSSALRVPAFEVLLALHELLGHGSGKLFIRGKNGKFNFDVDKVKHPETGKPITSWYEQGESFDSKFSVIAPSYEECRAECVSLYLSFNPDVLRIFGHAGREAEDIVYIIWLTSALAGVSALEYYTPKTRSWRQVHMNASYVILRVLLEAGEGLVEVKEVSGEDGSPDIGLTVDRAKIASVGKPAVGRFLRKMQVYKSTGDFAAGKKLYDFYSEVSDDAEPHFLSLRKIVLNRKQPRKMFVQHHTYVEGGEVKLQSYEPNHAGIIQSFVERFSSPDIVQIVQELWEREKSHF